MSDYSEGKPVSARLEFSGEVALKAETPMLIWSVTGHTWPGMAAHLTEPPLQSSGSPGGGTGATTPTPQPTQYVAVCDALHPSDLLGVNADGTWFGGTFDNLRDACNVVSTHEDGSAHVALYLGSHLVAVACS